MGLVTTATASAAAAAATTITAVRRPWAAPAGLVATAGPVPRVLAGSEVREGLAGPVGREDPVVPRRDLEAGRRNAQSSF